MLWLWGIVLPLLSAALFLWVNVILGHWGDKISKQSSLLKKYQKNDHRLNRLLNLVQHVAQQRGFPDFPIKVWMIPSFVKPNKTLAQCMRYKSGEIHIFVFRNNIRFHSEEHLLMLLAHEYGHALDFYTHRAGHPLLGRIKKLNDEEFADTIAAYLFSKERLMDAIQKNGWEKKYSIDWLSNVEFTRPHVMKSKA